MKLLWPLLSLLALLLVSGCAVASEAPAPTAAATPTPAPTDTVSPTPRPTRTPPPPTATRAPTKQVTWVLDWADEFDKPGLPDPAHWSYEEGLIRNNELQYYTRERLENARVEDGSLVI